MRKIIGVLLGLFSINCTANADCERVAEGYRSNDIMYVVCSELPSMTDQLASKIANGLMDQYAGPPDEVLIYFVSSPDFLGKDEIPDDQWVGYIYTHSKKLVVWPKLELKRQEYQITWD